MVMELVLDNRRQLGRSFEHCNTFCKTQAQAVRGKGTPKEKTGRDKGLNTDLRNESNFDYYVISPHMICI